MIDLPIPLAVVCHDAGATNLILPLIAEEQVLPVMSGPAAEMWRSRFGTTATLSADEAIDRAAAVLTGTGWASEQEHRARKLAKSRGLRTVAVIDHWVNYHERFVRGGEEVMPDEIWVTDDYAAALVRSEFPNIPVHVKPNMYLEEQLAKVSPLDQTDQELLFVAEPVRSDWGRDIPGEFQALNYFMDRRAEAGIPESAVVRIRPHPSDSPDKYDAWITSHPGARLDRSDDLASALNGARWVAGCESYALVVALHAGRQVISALPPWAPPCRLPHREIVRLATL